MEWSEIGSYLERPLFFGGVRNHSDLDVDDLASSAVVLLWIEEEPRRSNDDRDLIRRILGRAPLAITLAGRRAHPCFDILLELQSLDQQRLHTMTGVLGGSDIRECIEMFLYSVWPAEERWSAWSRYLIAVVGEASLCDLVRSEALEIIR